MGNFAYFCDFQKTEKLEKYRKGKGLTKVV